MSLIISVINNVRTSGALVQSCGHLVAAGTVAVVFKQACMSQFQTKFDFKWSQF